MSGGTPPTEGEFTLAVGRDLGTVVVTLGGRLQRSADARFLERVLDDLINAQGNVSVSVDLGRLSRLAPAGANVLAAAMIAARQRQGVLQIMAPRPAPAGATALSPVCPQDSR